MSPLSESGYYEDEKSLGMSEVCMAADPSEQPSIWEKAIARETPSYEPCDDSCEHSSGSCPAQAPSHASVVETEEQTPEVLAPQPRSVSSVSGAPDPVSTAPGSLPRVLAEGAAGTPRAFMCAWAIFVAATAMLVLSLSPTSGPTESGALVQAVGVAGLAGAMLHKVDAVLGAARDVLAHGMNERLSPGRRPSPRRRVRAHSLRTSMI